MGGYGEMTIYTITKNHQKTEHSTPNGLYLSIALEYLKEAFPDERWDYVAEETEA